jgi:hypothetical protein
MYFPFLSPNTSATRIEHAVGCGRVLCSITHILDPFLRKDRTATGEMKIALGSLDATLNSPMYFVLAAHEHLNPMANRDF